MRPIYCTRRYRPATVCSPHCHTHFVGRAPKLAGLAELPDLRRPRSRARRPCRTSRASPTARIQLRSPSPSSTLRRSRQSWCMQWSLIASRLLGRTDNEIKNYWNTILSKKVGDPQPRKTDRIQKANNFAPSSSSLSPPQAKNETAYLIRTKAIGCTKPFFPLISSSIAEGPNVTSNPPKLIIHNLEEGTILRKDKTLESSRHSTYDFDDLSFKDDPMGFDDFEGWMQQDTVDNCFVIDGDCDI